MDRCIKKLLGLPDEHLFLEEEWLETVENEAFRINVIHVKLSYIPSHCPTYGIKMTDKSRMVHIKQKSNSCLIERQKQNYTCYIRVFTVKIVSRHSTLRQI